MPSVSEMQRELEDLDRAYKHPIVAAAIAQFGGFVIEVDPGFGCVVVTQQEVSTNVESTGIIGEAAVGGDAVSIPGRGDAGGHATDPAFIEPNSGA